jgi:hypothetical protein
MKIAQGQRGTSAALGERQKQKPLPLSRFGAPLGAPNLDKGRLSGGVVYPGRRSLRSFALGYYLAAPPGRRTGGQAAFTANPRAGADAGQLAGFAFVAGAARRRSPRLLAELR